MAFNEAHLCLSIPAASRPALAKKTYLVLISRDDDGSLHRRPVPLQLAYALGAAAVIGLFTVAGLAGSYSRMLLKTERFNQLRREHDALRGDYAKLQKREQEKEVQAASLGALASEVSALYGLTARGAQGSVQYLGRSFRRNSSAGVQASSQITASAPSDSTFTNATYYKSLSDFYALRGRALDGTAMRSLSSGFSRSLGPQFDPGIAANIPTLWPLMGPITSPFGAREDPILGAGEGEFHKGVDISAPFGTSVRPRTEWSSPLPWAMDTGGRWCWITAVACIRSTRICPASTAPPVTRWCAVR